MSRFHASIVDMRHSFRELSLRPGLLHGPVFDRLDDTPR